MRGGRAEWIGALVVVFGAAPLGAQSLEERIDAARGDVAFHVATRDGVEVCENGDILRDANRWVRRRDEDGQRARCAPGPIRIVLERGEDGGLSDIEMDAVAAEVEGTDLGQVESAEAGPYLLARARDPELRTRGAERALMLSTLLRGFDPAPGLLEAARDRSLRDEVRKSALFWVGQEASERIGPHLAGIAADEAEDQEVRDAAVFALSRRPDDEAVPTLMELARSAPHAQTRRSALFWLARFDDPRIPEFFEALILRGG